MSMSIQWISLDGRRNVGHLMQVDGPNICDLSQMRTSRHLQQIANEKNRHNAEAGFGSRCKRIKEIK